MTGRISIRDVKSSTENRVQPTDSTGTRISRCSPARDRVYRLAARATRFIGSPSSLPAVVKARIAGRVERNRVAEILRRGDKGFGSPLVPGKRRRPGPHPRASRNDSRENNATSGPEYFIARKRVFLAASCRASEIAFTGESNAIFVGWSVSPAKRPFDAWQRTG